MNPNEGFYFSSVVWTDEGMCRIKKTNCSTLKLEGGEGRGRKRPTLLHVSTSCFLSVCVCALRNISIAFFYYAATTLKAPLCSLSIYYTCLVLVYLSIHLLEFVYLSITILTINLYKSWVLFLVIFFWERPYKFFFLTEGVFCVKRTFTKGYRHSFFTIPQSKQ